ncbi:MAG: PDZ domain-containing protein, partial [Pirellula sp.]
KNMGLKKTFQIGEIVIHPTDPNIVYVGALGRLYGNNEDRGVFKTTDGGENWEKVLYIDDRTGIIEMQMHPTDPNTLIATGWERLRDGFDSWPGNDIPIPEGYGGYDPIRKWGPGSGLYKTTDGGKNWKKLTKGLPTNQMGRIGIDWYRKDPNILVAAIDCENIGKGPAPLPVLWGAVGENRDGKVFVTQVYPRSPAARSGLQVGDILETLGDQPISDFDTILDTLRDKKAGDTFSTQILRGNEKRVLEYTLVGRGGGGGGGGGGQRTGPFFGAFGEDDEAGLKVIQMFPESAATKAGILADDVILEFDGAKVESWESLNEAVAGKNVGDKVKVKLLRSSESKELEVTLEARPGGGAGGGGGGGRGGAGNQPPQSSTYIGITGQNATAPASGAKLTEITTGGPAEKAGIMVGDIIQAVDGNAVADYNAALNAIRGKKAGETVTLKIARATEAKEISIVVANRPGPVRPYTASLGGQAASVQDQQGAKGYEYGGIYKSTDGGESWTRINSLHSRPMYFSVIRIDPNDEKRIYLLGVSQYKSSDGGLTFDPNLGRNVHADGHSLWIDPRDGRRMILGVDGGVYTTNDRGNRWDHLNTLAMGQFYHVAIAPKYPYYVYGGLQDNGTWGGPALSLNGSGPVNEDWLSVGGGDGFMCRVDPNDPELVYWTSQDGNMGRRNMKTGERGSIRPQPAEGEAPYRFNWNTPFILSNANSRVFYAAGNYVFRSWDRGNNLEKISPEITLTKRGSATALSESPRNPNILYVGSDDGALWVTKDGGKEWTEIGKNLNLPAPRWISTIEASRFADGRVYVCLDGHRSNDDDPYVFVSDDYGKSWKSIKSNLPWGSTRCLRESPFNENLLIVGTEFAVFASANRGGTWNSLNTNLPTVPVFDFAFHPNNGEIVAATHGRSLWIADITPLHQLAASHLNDSPYLYRSPTAIRWRREATRGGTNRRFVGENPPAGAAIYYSLPKKAEKVAIKIVDASGQSVREIRGGNDAGLQRVLWDLTLSPPPAGGGRGPAAPAAASATANAPAAAAATPAGATPAAAAPAATAAATPAAAAPAQTETAGGESGTPAPSEGQPAPRRGGFGGRTRVAPSGTYRVVLSVDGKEFFQDLRVISDPNAPPQNELATSQEEAYEVWMGDDVREDGDEEEEEQAERERQRDLGGEG